MNRFIRSHGKYVIILFLVIVAGNVLLYFTYQNVRQEMIDGLNFRQLIHAKQAAKGIETFFADHINVLQNYSKNENIINFGETGKQVMREYLFAHGEETTIISRIDSRGRIIHAEPYNKKVIGQPVTKMEDFLKVRRTHQVVVSDVFINRRGFKSIIIHAAVFKNGHFDGTLALLVSFEFIAKRYIDDIRIGKEGYAWIVSRNGIELSCPIPGHVGNSVFDNCRKFPDILAMAKRMTEGEQGVATYLYDRIRGDTVSKTIKHAVFMPIHFGDNFWSIVVATPENEVTGVLSTFRNKLLLIAILLLIGIGFFFYMLIKASIVVKESELRRKSEEALIQVTDRLSLAARAGGVGIWDYDIVNNVLVWDEQMYSLYGISADQFSGAYESWRAGLHPDDSTQGDEEIQLALRGEKDFDTEFRVVWPDGSIRTIRALAIIQRDSDGKPLRMIGTNWDITTQKQAEEETRRLASVVLHSRELMNLVTPDGTMIFLNDAGKRMLGISEEEVAQTTIMQVIPEHLQDKVKQEVLPAIVRDGYWEGELQYRNVKTGGLNDVYATTYKIADPETGVLQYLANVSLDITDRKRAEEKLRESEEQNRQLQKSESLGRMAAAIAHHFNNQLGVVIGNLELASMGVSKGVQPKAHISAAMKASLKAAEMSRLMITYLGQSPDKRELLDLSDTCLLDLPLLQAVMPGNVLLDNDLPLPGPAISANANQMQQVLTNLITNAREAAEEGGGAISLRVKTILAAEIPTNRRFPIDWQSQDNAYACLEVTDTGCGIDEKDIEKLFDPFYSTKFTGRGMGLAVVLGIVKAYKGVITVESELKRGSIFRVFLPVSNEEVVRTPQKSVSIADTGISAASPTRLKEGGTVLLVEDEAMVREMAENMLESLGYCVLTAKDGIEALEVFGKNQSEIQFVLTDLTMPRMSGWATLTALRKLQPGIPVILASGYDKAHVMAGDHPELPQAFLAKPYNRKALSDAIRMAMGRKKG